MYSFWSFIKRWFFSNNHKNIGSLYMFFTAFSNNLLIVLAGSALLLLLALAFLMVFFISPKVFEALYSADNANYVMLLLGAFILPVSKMLHYVGNILVGTAHCDPVDGLPVGKPVAKTVTLPDGVSINAEGNFSTTKEDTLVFNKDGTTKGTGIFSGLTKTVPVPEKSTVGDPGILLSVSNSNGQVTGGLLVDMGRSITKAANNSVTQAIDAQQKPGSHTQDFVDKTVLTMLDKFNEWSSNPENRKKTALELTKVGVGLLVEVPGAIVEVGTKDPVSLAKAAGTVFAAVITVKAVSSVVDLAAAAALGVNINPGTVKPPAVINPLLNGTTSFDRLKKGGKIVVFWGDNQIKPLETIVPSFKPGSANTFVAAPKIGTANTVVIRKVSSVVSRIFRPYSTFCSVSVNKKNFSSNAKMTGDKNKRKEHFFNIFLALLFIVQSLLCVFFVFVTFNTAATNFLQGSLFGRDFVGSALYPFATLITFFTDKNVFWNFTMGLSTSRLLYLMVMLLFFYRRDASLLSDDNNLWLSHFLGNYKLAYLLLAPLQKYNWFKKYKPLDQWLIKIFVLKGCLYALPFLGNLIFVRNLSPYVLLMGVLVMLLYQFFRFCVFLVLLFVYNIIVSYDIFEERYKINFKHFLPIVVGLNLVYNVLLSVIIVFLCNDWYDSTMLNEHLPTLMVLLVFLSFNYCIFYALLRCVTVLVLKFCLFLGWDLHKHLTEHAKFLELNYDIIAFFVVILYFLCRLIAKLF